MNEALRRQDACEAGLGREVESFDWIVSFVSFVRVIIDSWGFSQ